MDEDATRDAGHLRERVVAHTAPHLGKGLAAREALRRDGHRLDAPVAAGLVRVDDVVWLLGLGDVLDGFELKEVFLPRTERLE